MGRRFIRLRDGQLQHLRDHCQHGNRSCFHDQLVVARRLAFFNPILAGLRKTADGFGVPAVQKRRRMPHVPKSTLADARRLVDPESLRPLLEQFQKASGVKRESEAPADPRLDAFSKQLLAAERLLLRL